MKLTDLHKMVGIKTEEERQTYYRIHNLSESHSCSSSISDETMTTLKHEIMYLREEIDRLTNLGIEMQKNAHSH